MTVVDRLNEATRATASWFSRLPDAMGADAGAGF